MKGQGFIRDADATYHFNFRVGVGTQTNHERFTLTVRRDGSASGRQAKDDRFEENSISTVAFSNNPLHSPQPSGSTMADTVLFSGTGRWNGRSGYVFEVVAADLGEPAGRHDTVSIVIRDAAGTLMVSAHGRLAGGNVQAFH
jgi:hypothetical protein